MKTWIMVDGPDKSGKTLLIKQFMNSLTQKNKTYAAVKFDASPGHKNVKIYDNEDSKSNEHVREFLDSDVCEAYAVLCPEEGDGENNPYSALEEIMNSIYTSDDEELTGIFFEGGKPMEHLGMDVCVFIMRPEPGLADELLKHRMPDKSDRLSRVLKKAKVIIINRCEDDSPANVNETIKSVKKFKKEKIHSWEHEEYSIYAADVSNPKDEDLKKALMRIKRLIRECPRRDITMLFSI